MKPEELELAKIRIDGGTQPRASIDEDVVADYAERIADLPPAHVFFDGAEHWMADGFHRYHGNAKAGKKKMLVFIHKGTKREAILFSVGANAEHGLRRTNADKRRSVETLLKDEEWGKKSARWVADQAKVSHDFVCRVRNELNCHPMTVESLDGKTRSVTQKDPHRWTGLPNEIQKKVKSGQISVGLANAEFDKQKKENDVPVYFPSPPHKAELKKTISRDELGTEIKDPKIIAAFNRRYEILDLMGQVSKIKSTVESAVESKDPLFYRVNSSNFQAECNNARRELKMTLPHCLCPYCGGRGCKVCHNHGWVSKDVFDRYVPEDLKK